ncbi:hypothetical protein NDU88_000565 [Pleurodeles waltl]|uniref:Uncharacterized protein n=1 Tax=Pleurodeles waltl TaxID=8319 RepID=A0AAV7S9Z9_PLEWA|nr:hypothetical protein NDU88_000565 [Pleurodeles waltl]
MRGTGGGPSTIPPPTPLEERVEETLEPEAVCGMGELHTSEPGPSTGLPHDTTANQSIQGPQVSHQPAEESGPATTETCTTHTQSPHDAPVAILVSEPVPGPSHSATVDDTEPLLRRRRRVNVPPEPQAESGDASMSPAEATLLRGQRLQTREIRRISGARRRMEQNQNSGMQLVHTELQQL